MMQGKAAQEMPLECNAMRGPQKKGGSGMVLCMINNDE